MAIAKLSIDIEARLAGFERQLEKVAKDAEGMAGRVKSSFSMLGTTVGAAIGAIAAAGAVGQFRDMVNYLDQIGEAGERLGMTAEDLSALAYAGKMTGAEFEDVTSALTKLASKAQEAAAGNKSAVELFADLGVSVNDAAGRLKTSDQLLAEIADRFAGFEEGAAKTALAVDLFGRSGAKLVPLLNQGSAGIAAMRTEAEKLGGIVGNELAEQSAQFNDNLDKLGYLASTAGKALAGGLLPWLNEVAEGFIISAKNAESFWEILSRPIQGLAFFDVGDKLKTTRSELDALEVRRQGLLNEGLSTDGVEADIGKIKRTIEYYRELQRNQALAGGADYGNEGRGMTGEGGKEVIRRTGSAGAASKLAAPEATAEAKAYGDAMDALAKSTANAESAVLGLSGSQRQIYDLMTSPVWESMPDTWKRTAVAQFEQAYAAEQSAESTARFNRLIEATDSSKIEAARDDMLLLSEALERGVISEEKYLEAVNARLSAGSTEIERQKTLAEELGLTFTSAFEDAVVGGEKFSDVLKGIEQDIIRLLVRKSVTEPLGNAVGAVDWGSLAKSVVGWFSGTATANAKGGVYDSPSLSAYSGGVYSSPKLFAFANGAGVFAEAGPEAIMPLQRDAQGRLGVSAMLGGGGDVWVIVNNNADATARTERRTDARGNQFIEVIIEQTKSSIANDISRGSGAVPSAMEGVYGMTRKAGAY